MPESGDDRLVANLGCLGVEPGVLVSFYEENFGHVELVTDPVMRGLKRLALGAITLVRRTRLR